MGTPAVRFLPTKGRRSRARAQTSPSDRTSRARHARAFGKRVLAGFRTRLENEQARLRAELQAISGWVGAFEGRALQARSDESEGLEAIAGHSERDRERTLELSVIALLQEIRSALDRIACGRYGLCARCARRIPVARLRALPYAAMCVRCQEHEEMRDGRRQLTDRPETVRIPRAGVVNLELFQ